ncbi:hypothetical protein ACT8ZV_02575 [Nocardioides sp. MAHUQ-72]|uniref:hypothetical protein n=1 Tax=unclassified Nocardioides TaxID=2615069 RepID=UPI00361F463F
MTSGPQYDVTPEENRERILAERQAGLRRARLTAGVFGLVALGLVAFLLTPTQRSYLTGGAPSYDATVVRSQPAEHDRCRGRVRSSWDLQLQWTQDGRERTAWRSWCEEDSPGPGTHRRIWIREDGTITLDSPAKTRWAMGLLLLLTLGLGAGGSWLFLRQRPPLPS